MVMDKCRKKPSRHVSFFRLGLRLYRNPGLYRSSRDAQILGSVWALFLRLLSKICGLIPVPGVSRACDIRPFPSHQTYESQTIVWSPLEFCC